MIVTKDLGTLKRYVISIRIWPNLYNSREVNIVPDEYFCQELLNLKTTMKLQILWVM